MTEITSQNSYMEKVYGATEMSYEAKKIGHLVISTLIFSKFAKILLMTKAR